MAHNAGKGSISSTSSACGSRLCRCFVFVLIVLVSFLLYTCFTLMSRNEVLVDRIRSYGQQMAKLKFEQTNLARSLEQAKSQLVMQQNSLNQRAREADDFRQKSTECQRTFEEQKKKMEALGVELNSKDQMYGQLDQSCKQLAKELEMRTNKLKESGNCEKRADAYMNKVNMLQQSMEAYSRECQKRMHSEVGRIVEIIRKLYGTEPIQALAKAGIDISGALNAARSSESQGTNQNQIPRPGDGQPNQEQPKQGQETPKPGQEQPKQGQEQPKQGQETPKPSQEQPKQGQEQPKQGQETPKPGQEQHKQGQEQPKPGQETPKPGQEQPKQGQEQPKQGQDTPKPGQEQPKQGQETPKPDQEQPKQGQEQPKQGQEQPKSGQETPKPGQETPKPGQEQPKQGQEQPKPGDEKSKSGQEQPKPGEKKEEAGKGKNDDEYYEDEEAKAGKPKEAKQGQGQPGQEQGQPKSKTDQTQGAADGGKKPVVSSNDDEEAEE